MRILTGSQSLRPDLPRTPLRIPRCIQTFPIDLPRVSPTEFPPQKKNLNNLSNIQKKHVFVSQPLGEAKPKPAGLWGEARPKPVQDLENLKIPINLIKPKEKTFCKKMKKLSRPLGPTQAHADRRPPKPIKPKKTCFVFLSRSLGPNQAQPSPGLPELPTLEKPSFLP